MAHKLHSTAVSPRPDGLLVLAVRPPEGTRRMLLVYNVRFEVIAVLLHADDEALERMGDAVLDAMD